MENRTGCTTSTHTHLSKRYGGCVDNVGPFSSEVSMLLLFDHKREVIRAMSRCPMSLPWKGDLCPFLPAFLHLYIDYSFLWLKHVLVCGPEPSDLHALRNTGQNVFQGHEEVMYFSDASRVGPCLVVMVTTQVGLRVPQKRVEEVLV